MKRTCDGFGSATTPWQGHTEIDLHFVCEHVLAGVVRVLHVPTSPQYADAFTGGYIFGPMSLDPL
jgi:hypothetical protein